MSGSAGHRQLAGTGVGRGASPAGVPGVGDGLGVLVRPGPPLVTGFQQREPSCRSIDRDGIGAARGLEPTGGAPARRVVGPAGVVAADRLRTVPGGAVRYSDRTWATEQHVVVRREL